MEEERHRAAVDRARVRLSAGDDLDSVLATLRADGLSENRCINAVHELLGVNFGRARALVYLSPVFAGRGDENDAVPEASSVRSTRSTRPQVLSGIQPNNLAIFVPRWPSRYEWS